jgi:flagellar FliJ protein
MMAPSFRFRLERVRALREHHEDAAKEALAGAMARHRQSADQHRAAGERVAAARAAQLESASRPCTAVDLLARQAYLERTESAHHASRHDLHRHDLELACHRDRLAAAARDRQSLERLKEHRFDDHRRETARIESLALDEVAINAFRGKAA